MSAPRIGWYCGASGVSTASIRLRCLVPMEALRAQGHDVALSNSADERIFDAVIFSKAYDDRAYERAREMKARGTRIILDLCDNHWFGEDDAPAVGARARRLERMLDQVDLVTASTSTLANQIADRFRRERQAILVVPDPVLAPRLAAPSLRGRWELMRLRRRLAAHPEAARLVWFGNRGADHVRSGMEDLDRIRSILDRPGGRFTLTVISNSRARFRKLFRDWRLPMHYVPWRLDTVDHALALHDAAVIPITRNAFTIAKTMNRPATALMAGLDVFADRIPSYDELAPFVTLDDWARLRTDPPRRGAANERTRAAQDYLRANYSVERVAVSWLAAVDAALA